MEKKPLIIRCSDGWIYGLFGYYEEAVEAAEQHALNGVAYHDDTQIALVQAKKCYSAVEGLDVTVEEYTG